jgi:hypothetical protein
LTLHFFSPLFLYAFTWWKKWASINPIIDSAINKVPNDEVSNKRVRFLSWSESEGDTKGSQAVWNKNWQAVQPFSSPSHPFPVPIIIMIIIGQWGRRRDLFNTDREWEENNDVFNPSSSLFHYYRIKWLKNRRSLSLSIKIKQTLIFNTFYLLVRGSGRTEGTRAPITRLLTRINNNRLSPLFLHNCIEEMSNRRPPPDINVVRVNSYYFVTLKGKMFTENWSYPKNPQLLLEIGIEGFKRLNTLYFTLQNFLPNAFTHSTNLHVWSQLSILGNGIK